MTIRKELSVLLESLEKKWKESGLNDDDTCSVIANFLRNEEGTFSGEPGDEPIWLCRGLIPVRYSEAKAFYDWAKAQSLYTICEIAQGYNRLESSEPDRHFEI